MRDHPILRAALAYRTAGLSVIPLRRDKRPFARRLPQIPDPHWPGHVKGTWQPFRETAADERQLVAWFGDGRANIGIIGGQVSGGLVVLDFDEEADIIFPAWQEAVGSLAAKLPVVASSKGVHVYLRMAGALGNRTLAGNAARKKRIETRGEGGIITAPPSRHLSGHIYHWQQGNQTTIPTLTAAAVTAVLDAAAQFDERPRPISHPRPQTATSPYHPDADERLHRYAQAALHHEATALAQLLPGGRNDGLNRAAFCLGRYVGLGLLPQAQVVAGLQHACQTNGLIDDDGLRAFWLTLCSGLDAGMGQCGTRAQLLQRLGGEGA